MTILTKDRLRQLFDFDAYTGALIWRARPVEDFATVGAWRIWNKRYPGKVAGCINGGNGYRQIGIDGTQWKAHRLIWVYANGPIPDGMQIDHINGNRDDNRLENFRLVTHAENGRNMSMPVRNTSGVMGVSWDKATLKWRAVIHIDGRQKNLGYFDTAASAADARAKAEIDFGFHPGHGKVLANSPAAIRSLSADEARQHD